MAKKVVGSPTQIASALERRINAKIDQFKQGDPRIKEALIRIGILLETEIKLNIRRNRLIDTGNLINSIRYRLFQRGDLSGVIVGSFGVPYAAAHEFGFTGTQNVRSHTRNVTQSFGRPIKAKTANVAAFSRQMRIRARPYMKPAMRKHGQRVVQILRELVSGSKP
jgi:phage gpG-like protein